jgi:polysaccharide biosynthesis transport protein
MNMLAGLAAGLGLGLLAAIAAGLLDRTVKSAADIEALGVPVLGFLPFASASTSRATGRARKRRARSTEAAEGRPELYVHEHPRSVLAECCRTIRTNLAFMSATEELRTLVVTSAGPSEGKTTTSLSIAIAIAQGGSRTIIVDTDMRRPRLHKVLDVPADKGVTSVLIGEAKLEDCIYETIVPGLFVLPSGPIPPNPSELLHTPQFGKLVADLREQFQRVIFDSPPVGVVTDGAVIAPQVDGVIWVARAGVAQRDSVARTMRQIRDVRGRLVGAVLNAIDPGVQSYGSGYYDYQRSGYYLDAPEPVAKT